MFAKYLHIWRIFLYGQKDLSWIKILDLYKFSKVNSSYVLAWIPTQLRPCAARFNLNKAIEVILQMEFSNWKLENVLNYRPPRVTRTTTICRTADCHASAGRPLHIVWPTMSHRLADHCTSTGRPCRIGWPTTRNPEVSGRYTTCLIHDNRAGFSEFSNVVNCIFVHRGRMRASRQDLNYSKPQWSISKCRCHWKKLYDDVKNKHEIKTKCPHSRN